MFDEDKQILTSKYHLFLKNTYNQIIKKNPPASSNLDFDSVLKKRLIQTIIARYQFKIQKNLLLPSFHKNLSFEDFNKVYLHDIVIDLKSYKVVLKARGIVYFLTQFFFHWGKNLLSAFYLLVNVKKNKLSNYSRVNLYFGFSEISEASDLITFMNGKLFIKNELTLNLIHSPLKKKDTLVEENILTTSSPYKIILKNMVAKKHFISFIFCQFYALLSFFKLIIIDRSFIILAKDFAEYGTILFLNKHNILKNYSSSLSLSYQNPFWSVYFPKNKSFDSHLFWYSTNNSGHYYLKSPLGNVRHIDHHSFYYMQYNCGWYWNPEQASWAEEKIGDHKKQILGPIIFSKRTVNFNKSEASKVGKSLDIAIFDISPLGKKVIDDLSILYNYVSDDIVIKFIDDILNSASTISRYYHKEVNLFLKPKRIYPEHRDHRYQSFLVESKSKHKNLHFIHHETDIYDLINNTSLSIVFPYSSTTYLSHSLGKNSLYYDPTGQLEYNSHMYEKYRSISFVKNSEDLQKYLANFIE